MKHTLVNNPTRTSKFLSLVLRHNPERIGITLDRHGWTSVAALLAACQAHNFPLTLQELQHIVATNDKQRFSFNEDGTLMRANQGHSVNVELELEPLAPPPVLYHGTVEKFLAAIRAQGLIKGTRHHVHLSADAATARKVGARRGTPIVLEIAAARMHRDDFIFYQSANKVWLTDHVPASYITFPAHDKETD